MSRCVRRAFLLAEGPANRKEWIENRIEELVPETSEYTSITTRVEHVEAQGQTDTGSSGWKSSRDRLFGRFLAASGEKLQQVAAHLGLRRVANLAGCPAR